MLCFYSRPINYYVIDQITVPVTVLVDIPSHWCGQCGNIHSFRQPLFSEFVQEPNHNCVMHWEAHSRIHQPIHWQLFVYKAKQQWQQLYIYNCHCILYNDTMKCNLFKWNNYQPRCNSNCWIDYRWSTVTMFDCAPSTPLKGYRCQTKLLLWCNSFWGWWLVWTHFKFNSILKITYSLFITFGGEIFLTRMLPTFLFRLIT